MLNRAAVCLWDKKGGLLEATFPLNLPKDVSTLVFSPDGKPLERASTNNRVLLWDVEKQSRIHSCTTSIDYGTHLSFCQTGRFLKTREGIIDLDPIVFKTNHQPARPVIPLHVLNEWIIWCTQKIILIPPEFRPYNYNASDTHGGAIAIGNISGQLTFLRLNLEKIPLDERPDTSKSKPPGRDEKEARRCF